MEGNKNRGRGRKRKTHAFARRGSGEGDAKENGDSSFVEISIVRKCDRNMLKNGKQCA
jgi:hypothetical protein